MDQKKGNVLAMSHASARTEALVNAFDRAHQSWESSWPMLLGVVAHPQAVDI